MPTAAERDAAVQAAKDAAELKEANQLALLRRQAIRERTARINKR